LTDDSPNTTLPLGVLCLDVMSKSLKPAARWGAGTEATDPATTLHERFRTDSSSLAQLLGDDVKKRFELGITLRRMERPRVLLVHGHDARFLSAVKWFLASKKIQAIVLAEEAAKGLETIIEKLERLGEADFASALVTAGDVGRLRGGAKKSVSRARQDIVLEIGYFISAATVPVPCGPTSSTVTPPRKPLQVTGVLAEVVIALGETKTARDVASLRVHGTPDSMNPGTAAKSSRWPDRPGASEATYRPDPTTGLRRCG
jgi:hypothetical protein